MTEPRPYQAQAAAARREALEATDPRARGAARWHETRAAAPASEDDCGWENEGGAPGRTAPTPQVPRTSIFTRGWRKPHGFLIF